MPKNYQQLARTIDARLTCIKVKNYEWEEKHTQRIQAIIADGPSGSGFDNGTHIDLDASTGEKIVLTTSFHHMDDHGFYNDWTDHTIIVRASLLFDFDMKISGENKRGIKDYALETFRQWLTEEVKVPA